MSRRIGSLVTIVAAGVVASALAVTAVSGGAPGFERGAGLLAALALVVLAAAARPAWTLSLGLAASVFNTHWNDAGIPFSVDRLLLVVGIVSVLLRELQAGGLRRLRTRPVHWLIAVAALYALASALLDGALADTAARYSLIDRLGLIPFAVFFVAPYAFREERDRRVLLGTLVALGAYLGLVALLETTGPKSLIVPSYITDPNVGIHADRARGPFTEASANGFAMFACLIASVMALGVWRSPRWRRVALAVAALCALGVLFTLTRSAWLGAGLGAVAALLAYRRTRRLLMPAAAVAMILVLGAFAAIPGLSGKADSRTNAQSPVWDRKNSDGAAIRMVETRPLLGFGWGTFRYEGASYYVQSPDYPLTFVPDVHNLFLAHAVELGLLGAGLWLLAVLAGVGGAIFARGPPELSAWKIGLLALFVDWLVIANTTPMSVTMPTLLLWAWAGIARGGRSGPTPATAAREPHRAVGRLALAAR